MLMYGCIFLFYGIQRNEQFIFLYFYGTVKCKIEFVYTYDMGVLNLNIFSDIFVINWEINNQIICHSKEVIIYKNQA